MNLAEKAKELRQEQKKSDAILFQMLPTSVAIKLKQTRQVLREHKNENDMTFLFPFNLLSIDIFTFLPVFHVSLGPS